MHDFLKLLCEQRPVAQSGQGVVFGLVCHVLRQKVVLNRHGGEVAGFFQVVQELFWKSTLAPWP